jgi:hypothetical protein
VLISLERQHPRSHEFNACTAVHGALERLEPIDLVRATASATHLWWAPIMERRSSGSSLAESAVEPTRSVNITVSWQRSASSRRVGAVATGVEGAATATETLPRSDLAQHFAAVIERHNPEIFEVLVGRLSNDAFIDVVFDKAIGVLGHAELF